MSAEVEALLKRIAAAEAELLACHRAAEILIGRRLQPPKPKKLGGAAAKAALQATAAHARAAKQVGKGKGKVSSPKVQAKMRGQAQRGGG